MGRKVGLTLDQIIEAAATIADRDGLDTLSLASVASRLGVRSPSLYNHVDGLAGLRRLVAMHGAAQLSAQLSTCTEGLDGLDALRATTEQMRSFAHRHPGLNAAFLPAPTPDDDPELAAALVEPVRVIAAILDGLHIEPEHAIALIRALRAAVHGFVDLELRGGFGLPHDIDESFNTTIDLVLAGVADPGYRSSVSEWPSQPRSSHGATTRSGSGSRRDT